jgi:hypothetical protein
MIEHGHDDLLLATPYRIVDVTDDASQAAGIKWWEELTVAGGEGMVVNPAALTRIMPRRRDASWRKKPATAPNGWKR